MDEKDIVTVRIEKLDSEPAIKARYAMYSDVGDRENQQDSLFIGEKSNELFAVLCDGMGGLQGGERASALAVEMYKDSFYKKENEPIPGFLQRITINADDAVYELESNDGKPLGAGSTVVAVLLHPDGIYWLSVGDSRIYICRGEEMICPVPAHNYRTILNQKLAAGKIDQETYEQEIPRGAGLVSYLGMGGVRLMEINQNPFQPEPGDQILLCCDGLYKSLSDDDIHDILNIQMSPEEKAQELVNKALENGRPKQDNTSVIILSL